MIEPAGDPAPPDQAARDFAVDPRHHVVLEASAGTGKTRVLVDRYVRLIETGVDPRHILAMTFTRKAAAEMRERVLETLRRRAAENAAAAARWRALAARVADIQISTIDAFCFGLLREFPLEADVDPAFEIADETEMARFAAEAVELAIRAARRALPDDEHLRLLFARVSLPVLSEAIQSLVDRRHVARPAVARFVAGRPIHRAADAADRFVGHLRAAFADPAVCRAILDDGPQNAPLFRWLAADLRVLDALPRGDAARAQQLHRRLERYFLRKDGQPRARTPTGIART